MVTQGNGSLVLTSDVNLDPGTVFSNEGLFVRLSEGDALERLLSRVQGDLRVILYTRNVFGFLVSSWGQKVKTAQMKDDLDTYLRSYADDHYGTVLFWIEAAQKHGFELVFRNYSNHSREILPDFLRAAFGDKIARLSDAVSQGVVNRSLTVAESYLQLLFNRHLDRPSRDFVSFPLVQELPYIEAERPFFAEDTYEAIKEQHRPVLDAIVSATP